MSNISLKAQEILKLLKSNKNVILMGPPGCGKSYVMSEVAHAFTQNSSAGFDPSGEIPYPQKGTPPEYMPSAERTVRNVHQITFHQGTKYRDFVGGITPKLNGQNGFTTYSGKLDQANNEACTNSTTSLVCIDEINRGPAVAAFGDTLTALEKDKRLSDDNTPGVNSFPFHLPGENGPTAKFLSPHLYILAAMNEADTSVEPLDVAFLRRFAVVRLNIDHEIAKQHLRLQLTEEGDRQLPPEPKEISDVYRALFRAWTEMNRRIELGKGRAYLIGHGVLMNAKPPSDLPGALNYVREAWSKLQTHALEVFYGNDQALSVVFNANPAGPFKVEESQFGDQPVARLRIPETREIYAILKQVAGS